MSRAVSRPLLEKTFHMKIQSRKAFAHREGFEAILAKTEETLARRHADYCAALEAHSAQRAPASAAAALDAHNDYVQQLRAANGMIQQYYRETLPQLLQVKTDSETFPRPR